MFTLIYVIGFVISVVLAILWERNGPTDHPWSAYGIVTISVLWPVSVPLIAFLSRISRMAVDSMYSDVSFDRTNTAILSMLRT